MNLFRRAIKLPWINLEIKGSVCKKGTLLFYYFCIFEKSVTLSVFVKKDNWNKNLKGQRLLEHVSNTYIKGRPGRLHDVLRTLNIRFTQGVGSHFPSNFSEYQVLSVQNQEEKLWREHFLKEM